MTVQPVAYQPYNGLLYMLLHDAVTIVQQTMATVVDMVGTPVAIPVRPEFVGKTAEFSEITVGLEIGRAEFGNGKNLLDQDDTTGVKLFGFRITDSALRLGVKARSHAERFYILDALISSLVASFTPTPPPGGYNEGSVLDRFMQAGIVIGGFGPVEVPEPQLDEERPEGLVYPAVIPFFCDLWVAWNNVAAPAVWPVQVQPTLWNPGNIFAGISETVVVS